MSKVIQSNILFDKYRVEKILHKSKGSVVYLARHMQLGDRRVIKEVTRNSLYADNFFIEINILKEIHHDSIPIIYDIEQDEYNYYIVEEYIEGVSLQQLVDSNGCLSESKAIGYGFQITNIIAFLHSNKSNPILFLDLQPKNIIVNNDKIFLIDFGCSMIKNILERDKIFGTSGYAAPEQYTGAGLGVGTDIFGIGSILCYMVTATNPKEGMDILIKNDSISRRFKQIILRCTQDNIKQRYSDTKVLLQHMEIISNACNEEKNKDECDGKPLYISVIGTEAKVGTTFISFQMAKYMEQLGYDVIYKENNMSGHMHSFKEMHSDCVSRMGLFIYNNLKIMPGYDGCVDIPHTAEVMVLDEGEYDPDKTYADIVFLVSGSSEWEIRNTKMLTEKYNIDTDVIFNMCNESRHEDIKRYMERMEGIYYFDYTESMTGTINKSFFDCLLQGVIIIQGNSTCVKKENIHKFCFVDYIERIKKIFKK